MKPLHLCSITKYIWTYAALYTLDIEADIKKFFLSQGHERHYVLIIHEEIIAKHTSFDAIYAAHHNP